MSLFRYTPHDYFYSSPMERLMVGVLDDALDLGSQSRPSRRVAPYWINQPALGECNIGNAIGNVIDSKEKFAVEVDVSQFSPKELSVDVRDRELILEGHHKERSDQSGTIQRHFIRKYAIPDDVHLDSLESHLSDKGVLSVSAKKLAIDQPASRKIPIKAAPKFNQNESKKAEGDAKK